MTDAWIYLTVNKQFFYGIWVKTSRPQVSNDPGLMRCLENMLVHILAKSFKYFILCNGKCLKIKRSIILASSWFKNSALSCLVSKINEMQPAAAPFPVLLVSSLFCGALSTWSVPLHSLFAPFLYSHNCLILICPCMPLVTRCAHQSCWLHGFSAGLSGRGWRVGFCHLLQRMSSLCRLVCEWHITKL